MAEKMFGNPPYTIIKTSITKARFNELAPDLKEAVDRGIDAILIPTEKLHLLEEPEILQSELLQRWRP